MNHSPEIIVALDFDNPAAAEQFADGVDPSWCKLKVGKELFTRAGPDLVKKFIHQGFDIFLDLKFHDIPATVAKAVASAADLGVWMTDLHALGGARMMTMAREQVDRQGSSMLLIAVTVLTSMDEHDLRQIGINLTPREQVSNLASLAKASGMDGVVCSAQEAGMLRQQLGEEFCLVTPGIRPDKAGRDDQKRTVTPKEAYQLGSNYLVVGRPITRAENPVQALLAIKEEIT